MERNPPPGLMMMAKKERENMHHCRLSIWLLGPSHVSPWFVQLFGFSACYLHIGYTTLHLLPFPIICRNFFLSTSLCWAAGPLSGVRLMIRIAGQQFHPLRLLTLLNFLPIYTSLAYSVTCYMLYTKWSVTGYMLYILPIIHMQLFGLL